MAIFNQQRLTNDTLRLDVDQLRRGDYADRYFANIVHILQSAHDSAYTFSGAHSRLLPVDADSVAVGDLMVEAQVFSRHVPRVLVAGVDVALAMLRYCTGYFEGSRFVETWADLDVEAVEDGSFTTYDGDPENVRPVLKIRGRYRDFAILETAILGVLSRASRLATTIYDVVQAASGKPVLFFPARFDLPEAQPLDGYAYWLAVERYHHDTGRRVPAIVSTNAQGAWWGGRGSGTIPHALIAAYLGDTAEATVAFARAMPPDVPRVALVDFNNHTSLDAARTAAAFWPHYRAAARAGDAETLRRWTLNGVRLDTSLNVRDYGLGPDDPYGVSPALVRLVRDKLDNAWKEWGVSSDEVDLARDFCRNVKIYVTGGFNAERIWAYERDHVPVDAYGVGSTLLRNDAETNTDYTLDLVHIQLDGQWVEMAKVGRRPNDNADLQPVDLSGL